jgi:hypothetical protein
VDSAVPRRSAIRAIALLAVLLALADAAAATEPSDRARPERPWWREALELPEDGASLFFEPIRLATISAERVNLPERIRDLFYFNDAETAGWFPKVSVGGEIQSAYGADVFHDDLLGGHEEAHVSGLVSTRDPSDEGEWRAKLLVPSVRGSRFDVLGEFLYQDFDDREFFLSELPGGRLRIGQQTTQADQKTADVDLLRGRFDASGHPRPGLRIGFAFEPLYGGVREGKGSEPPIPRDVDGFGGPAVLAGGGPYLEADSRPAALRARRGWFARLDGGAWQSVKGETTRGDDYRYARYRLELRRYQPTFQRDRAIVVRLVLERVEPFSGGRAPFWSLPTLDKDHGLRGFERNRFVDRGAALLNTEYRYPFWDTWDAYLFFDEGQVFDRYSNLAIGEFAWSAGAGLRFYSSASFLARVQLAVSEEDEVVQIGLAEEF